ncbi:MAG: AMP-binding protein [Rhodococcus sp. (in: high G+C Gram-positive bacteria)]
MLLDLTGAQLGILNAQLLDPSNPAFNIAEYVDLRGDLDVEQFVGAVRAAIVETDAIRVRAVLGGEQPRQEIMPAVNVPVEVIELVDRPDSHAYALERMRADLAVVLDPAADTLCRHVLYRIAPQRFLWYHRAHHFALDGYAFSLIAARVSELYRAAVTDCPAPEATPRSLKDVVDEYRSYAHSAQRLADRDYWVELLARTPPAPTLSGERGLPSSTFLRSVTELSETQFLGLVAASRAARVVWSDLLLALVAALTAQETETRGISLGVPVANRIGSSAIDVPCMVLGAITVPVQVRPFDSVASLAQAIAKQLRRSRTHSRYRYEDLRAEAGALGGDRRLFGPVVNIMAFDYHLDFASVTATAHNLTPGPVEDITVDVYRRSAGSGLTLCIDANPRRYDNSGLDRIARTLTRMLTAATVDPFSRTGDLTREVVSVSEFTHLTEPADTLALIAARSDADPTAPALTGTSVAGTPYALTRSQLIAASRTVADAVLLAAPSVESIVFFPSGAQSDIVVILAALVLNLPYSALDANTPDLARRLTVLEHLDIVIVHDSAMRTVATDTALHLPRATCLEYGAIQEHSAHRQPSSKVRPPADPSPDAYIVFTSGSTGTPKAITITRASLNAFVAGVRQVYRFDDNDRVLQFAPLQADTSVEEIFVSLASGATIVRPHPADRQSLRSLLDLTRRESVTVLDLPTALWHEMVVGLDSGNLALPPSIRTVIIGGETASPVRLAQWHRVLGHENHRSVRLINTYGPSEATVVATTTDLQAPGDPEEPVSIGRPLSTVGAFLLADSLDSARTDNAFTEHTLAEHTGELCLYGPTVASGYHAAGDEAESAFGTVILGRGTEYERSVHAYRTGDLVTMSNDGSMKFVGRTDDRVKISGHRVVPAAIDEIITDLPGVTGSATVISDHGGIAPAVHSFVLTADRQLTPADISASIDRTLPPVSRPRTVRILERLPLTRNGKIDRAALLTLVEAAAPALDSTPVDGISDTEAAILAVWAEVTGVSGITVDSDFFLLGGHSMHTIAAANRLSATLGFDVSPQSIFTNPTARGLAGEVDGQNSLPAENAAREVEAMRRDLDLLCHWPSPSVANDDHAEDSTRHVLLTGSTGFVGTQVLRELLGRPEVAISVLVRAATGSDPSNVRNTIQQNIIGQCEALSESETRRLTHDLRIVVGDLTLPRFGLEHQKWIELAQNITDVINCAAVVSPLRRYSSVRSVNTVAVSHLIALCRSGRRASFHQISTTGVETNQSIRQYLEDSAASGYLASKAIAEHIVGAAAQSGTRSSVIRLGRVLGSRNTGAVNSEDTLWNVLRASAAVGCYPAVDFAEPLSCVDDVARAIVEQVLDPDPSGVVITIGPRSRTSFADIVDWVRLDTKSASRVELEQWHHAVEKASSIAAQHKQLIAAWCSAVSILERVGTEEAPDSANAGVYRALPNVERDALSRMAGHDRRFVRGV